MCGGVWGRVGGGSMVSPWCLPLCVCVRVYVYKGGGIRIELEVLSWCACGVSVWRS